MTVENDHFRAFFRMVLQKLVFPGKRGRSRAKCHEIKVVGNAILKTFYFITFFPGMHPLAVNDIILSSPIALRFSRSFGLRYALLLSVSQARLLAILRF